MSTDREGRVTSWNRAAEEVFGYWAFEMLGQFGECLVPQDIEDDQADPDRTDLREDRMTCNVDGSSSP